MTARNDTREARDLWLNTRAALAELTRLRGIAYRAEKGQLTGRNRAATEANVAASITRALTAIVAIEDAQGVGAAGDLGARLMALRWRLTDAGLIDTSEYLRIEREVCA